MQSKDEIEITMAPLEMIPALWPKIAFHFSRGCRGAALPVEMEMERLIAGLDELWLIVEGVTIIGVFVTTLCRDEEKRFVGVSNLSGEGVKRWAALLSDRVLEYARANGCAYVHFYGKPGWRHLIPHALAVGERDGHTLFERAA